MRQCIALFVSVSATLAPLPEEIAGAWRCLEEHLTELTYVRVCMHLYSVLDIDPFETTAQRGEGEGKNGGAWAERVN